MKKPENDVCETHSRAFFVFVNGVTAQSAVNRATTGTWYNSTVLGDFQILSKKFRFFNAYNIIQLKSFLIYTGSYLAIELVFFFVSGIHEQYPFGPALGNALLSIALPTVFWAFSYLVYVAFKYGFNLQENVDEVI